MFLQYINQHGKFVFIPVEKNGLIYTFPEINEPHIISGFFENGVKKSLANSNISYLETVAMNDSIDLQMISPNDFSPAGRQFVFFELEVVRINVNEILNNNVDLNAIVKFLELETGLVATVTPLISANMSDLIPLTEEAFLLSPNEWFFGLFERNKNLNVDLQTTATEIIYSGVITDQLISEGEFNETQIQDIEPNKSHYGLIRGLILKDDNFLDGHLYSFGTYKGYKIILSEL